MSLDLANLVPQTPKRRRGSGRMVVAVAASVIAAAVAAGIALKFSTEDAAPPAPEGGQTETDARPPAPEFSLPADMAAMLRPYPRETALDGRAILAEGRLDEARAWFRSYLAAPTDGREDQALLWLAVTEIVSGQPGSAEPAIRRLIDERRDSPRAGDGWYLLSAIRSARGELDAAREAHLEAVRVYPNSEGGRRSARLLADQLYDEHVVQYTRRAEWERIRDLYSHAIGYLRDESCRFALPGEWDRAELIRRLDELNQWVVFTPHARPKEDYPSNIVFHRVGSGDTLGGIARRYGVPVGSVKRLNGIPADSHIIRPGEELKIVRGRTEIHVNIRELLMTVWIDGRFFRQYEVGTGREGRTPPGRFKIASRLVDPDWWYLGEAIPFGDPRNILGTRWLGFEKAGAGRGIGIHGSQEKGSEFVGVGERASNGCVRMRNPDVEELYDFVPEGTEVVIYE